MPQAMPPTLNNPVQIGQITLYRGGFRNQTEFFLWGSKGPLVGSGYSPGLFSVRQQPGEKLHQVSEHYCQIAAERLRKLVSSSTDTE